MSFKLAAFICLFLISFSTARVIRDAPNENTHTFGEVFDFAANQLKEFQNTISKAFGVENAEQLQQKAVEEGKIVASKIDEWANDVKKQTENIKDNTVVKDLRSSVDKIVDEFKAKNPNTTAEIKTFFQNIETETGNVFKKIKDLNETEEANNIKDLSRKLLDNAVVIFQNAGKQIQESIKSAN